MLKGHVFKDQVFGNQIYALANDTFLNGMCGIFYYKENMKITKSQNKLVVYSGCICIRGRLLEEDTYTEIDTDTDNAFCKLVIEIDLDKENTDTVLKQAQYKIVKSISGYPNLTQNNIVANNSGVYQYELARFKTSSSGISDFKDMRTFLSYQYLFAEIMKELNSIKDGSAFVLKEQGKGLSTNDFTNTLLNKLNGIALGANNYIHPTSAGNKHIPSGGMPGQILVWSGKGTAEWGEDKDTTYSVATTRKNGLMSAEDKLKLNYCLQETNLYNNTNGTTGEVIFLTNLKSEFIYIDVFAKIGEAEVFERVNIKNTNKLRLRDSYGESGMQYSFRDELLTISNTKISRNSMVSFTVTNAGQTAFKTSATQFKITKVVGYSYSLGSMIL